MIKAVAENYANQLRELLSYSHIVEVKNIAKRKNERYAENVVVVDGQIINEPEGFIQGIEFCNKNPGYNFRI